MLSFWGTSWSFSESSEWVYKFLLSWHKIKTGFCSYAFITVIKIFCFYGGILKKFTIPIKCDSVAIFRKSVRAGCSVPVANALGMHVTLRWHNWFLSRRCMKWSYTIAMVCDRCSRSPYSPGVAKHTRIVYIKIKFALCLLHIFLWVTHYLILWGLKHSQLYLMPNYFLSAGPVTYQLFLVAEPIIWTMWQQEVGKENEAIPDKNLAQLILLKFGNSPVSFGDILQMGMRAGKLSFSIRKKVPDLRKESAVELHHRLCQKPPEQHPERREPYPAEAPLAGCNRRLAAAREGVWGCTLGCRQPSHERKPLDSSPCF